MATPVTSRALPRALRRARSATEVARQLGRLVGGYASFLRSGRTPDPAYAALRSLYCWSDGRLNDAYGRVMSWLRPATMATLAPVEGLLGRFDRAELEAAVTALDRDGIFVFPQRLPEPLCEELLELAHSTPSLPLGSTSAVLYAAESASALRHDFAETDLVRSRTVCSILSDPLLVALAAGYFRAVPTFDFVAMWWSTCCGVADFSKAAQLFHFDMDRLRFLKYFIYLAEVTEETGPHVFVAGSHRRKPRRLREDRRFSDAEVEAHYEPGRILRLTGPRGLVFAADTRALHKGMPLARGHRLLLQLQFSLDRFGQNYPLAPLPVERAREVEASTRRSPRTFAHLLPPPPAPDASAQPLAREH